MTTGSDCEEPIDQLLVICGPRSAISDCVSCVSDQRSYGVRIARVAVPVCFDSVCKWILTLLSLRAQAIDMVELINIEISR